MAELVLRADIPLREPIVLATRDGADFPAIAWTNEEGDDLAVRPVTDMARARRMLLANEGDNIDWWVNPRVHSLHVEAIVRDIEPDDIERLLSRHPTEETFLGDGLQRQHAEQVGTRIVKALTAAVNDVLYQARHAYGQFWLVPIDEPRSIQDFFLDVSAEFLYEKEWRQVWVSPRKMIMDGFTIGAHEEYVKVADWIDIQRRIENLGEVPTSLRLMTEAWVCIEAEDKQIAILHMNSALEAAAQAFVRRSLSGTLPEKTMAHILKMNHGPFLNVWVEPLWRKLTIPLDQEWPSVLEIQQRRQEAGHPSRGEASWRNIPILELMKLASRAESAIAKLLGLPRRKTPPQNDADVSAGGSRPVPEQAD